MDIVEERARTYGGEADGYTHLHRTAHLWTAYLGTEVTAHDVCWLLTMMKASRAKQDPARADGENYRDAHGYVTLAERLR